MQTKYLQSQIFPLKLQMLFTCNDRNCEKSCRVATVAEIAPVLLIRHTVQQTLFLSCDRISVEAANQPRPSPRLDRRTLRKVLSNLTPEK